MALHNKNPQNVVILSHHMRVYILYSKCLLHDEATILRTMHFDIVLNFPATRKMRVHNFET